MKKRNWDVDFSIYLLFISLISALPNLVQENGRVFSLFHKRSYLNKCNFHGAIEHFG